MVVGICVIGGFKASRVGDEQLLVSAPERPTEGNLSKDTAIIEYLDRLSAMESCGKGIVDTNGLISRGDFCFQDRTFLSEAKKIYPEAEPQELLNVLGDHWTQEQIVRNWIKENPKLLEKHFYTTVITRKLGLPNASLD